MSVWAESRDWATWAPWRKSGSIVLRCRRERTVKKQRTLLSAADFTTTLPFSSAPQRTPESRASSRAWCAMGRGRASSSSWAPPSPTAATAATHWREIRPSPASWGEMASRAGTSLSQSASVSVSIWRQLSEIQSCWNARIRPFKLHLPFLMHGLALRRHHAGL